MVKNREVYIEMKFKWVIGIKLVCARYQRLLNDVIKIND
jgi:hypothetical protein